MEDGKILKVGRSQEVPWSLPHLPPPPWQLFQLGQKHTISNFRGGILSGGAYAPPVLKQGGICTLCPTAAHASALWDKFLSCKYVLIESIIPNLCLICICILENLKSTFWTGFSTSNNLLNLSGLWNSKRIFCKLVQFFCL